MTNTTLATITSSTTTRPMLVVASQKVTATGLLEAAYGGTVRFSKVRENGTLRSWPVLAKGSAQRKAAEALAADKRPVAVVAKEANVSVATLRRTLTSLKFTLEVEGLSAKAKAAVVKAANENMVATPKAEPKKAEPKVETPKAEPKAKVAPKAAPKASPKGKAKESNADRLRRIRDEKAAAAKAEQPEA